MPRAVPAVRVGAPIERSSGNMYLVVYSHPFLGDGRIRYIRTRETGVSRSRNRSLSEARCEFVLNTDDDCVVASDWIDYLHVAKWNGRWVIVNVLWELKQPSPTQPASK